MSFINENFLLLNETSKILYHEYANDMPIVDYHCHIDPKEIAGDKRYENLTQVWLSGDHYKWRLMRANGADESEVTGDSSDWTKFMRYAEVLPKAAGNPLYHWTHLELKRYFDCDLTLNPSTAKEIWEHCGKVLRDGLSVRRIITGSNVEIICTTDDPADDLKWHKAIAEDDSFPVRVLPAMRPDKAMSPERDGFADYIGLLSETSGVHIASFDDVFPALGKRIEHFNNSGCRLSDHALDYCFYRRDKNAAESAFKKAMNGEKPTRKETESYKTELLLFLAERYRNSGWVMQIHFGALRNANSIMTKSIGPDSGFDCVSAVDSSSGLVKLLDAISTEGGLPKTILYSVNPNDNAMIMSAAGCFLTADGGGSVRHGSAWWFNDTKHGMLEHMTNLASIGVLGNFLGMLTDSRSFLSYTRHEYFRRILCGFIGELIEKGEYPDDIETAGKMVRDISYNNAVNYFGF